MSSDKTTTLVAKKAASVSSSSKSGSTAKSLAGSALAQTGTLRTTSAHEARIAAKVLANPTSAQSARFQAASVLSQKKSPFPVKTYRVSGSSLTQKQIAEIVRTVAAKKSK